MSCAVSLQIKFAFRCIALSVFSYRTTQTRTLIVEQFSAPCLFVCTGFLDSEGGSPNATLVLLVLVLGISSLRIPKAFLICSGAQRSVAYTFVLTLPTDLPSQIFNKLICN